MHQQPAARDRLEGGLDDPQIVIVAFHNTDDLQFCLESVGGGPLVIVVDNGADDDAERVCRVHKVRYIRSPGNVGFAAAVNVALVHADPDRDVLLLNPDARITPTSVRELCTRLRREPRLAALSPRLLGDQGLARVEWPIPSPSRAWAEAVGLARFVPSARRFVIGAVLLLRRESIDELGGFDERFFLYSEEADWQMRAVRAGWTVAVEPAVKASHTGSGSSSNELKRQVLFHRSVELFVRKWYGPTGWNVFRAAVILGAALRFVAGRGSRAAQAHRLRLYLTGPVRQAGHVGGA